jgi:hypothetical protein
MTAVGQLYHRYSSKGVAAVTRTILVSAILTTAIAFAVPAHAALLTRTFVSSAGSDASPCTIASPCATLAGAYAKTAANGIIAALDPGQYGPVTITGPITINGNGWGSVTPPLGGNGVTINAGPSDHIALLGLKMDGAGVAYNGVVLNSAGSLTVDNCVLLNFVESTERFAFYGNGILIQPLSGTIKFSITNTTALDNAFAGISYFLVRDPGTGESNLQVNGVIDHFNAGVNNTQAGIYVYTAGAPGSSTTIAVSNSVLSNSFYGILAEGSGDIAHDPAILNLFIDHNEINDNVIGVSVVSSTNVLLGRSNIMGNGTGVENGMSEPNRGPNKFYTYQNNRIDLNGTDIVGSLNPAKVLR